MATPLQISTQICNGLPDLVYIKEARKAIAFMPLGALEINVQTVEIYNCLMVPFTEEKMPWYPCPYKNEAYVAERLRAQNSNSGVSDQQSVGSNPKP